MMAHAFRSSMDDFHWKWNVSVPREPTSHVILACLPVDDEYRTSNCAPTSGHQVVRFVNDKLMGPQSVRARMA